LVLAAVITRSLDLIALCPVAVCHVARALRPLPTIGVIAKNVSVAITDDLDGSPGGPRVDRAAVRAWAQEAGLAVSERGRISAQVMNQYEAAH
jgi:hypothetical protein